MKLTSYLGLHLKSDDVLEVLDAFKIENVVYDFDRLHENTADKYWASAKQAGFQFCFNSEQLLDVVFCYIKPHSGFSEIHQDIIGVEAYPSFQAAEHACTSSSAPYKAGADQGYLRVERSACSVHYEYRGGALTLITLMLPRDSK